MCFSATASFSVAATTAVIGLAALKQVKHPQELPLAVMPLLFAFQQTVEGVLWLQLFSQSDSGTVAVLSFIYLFVAEVIWPFYAALAVFLIEPDHHRRRILGAIAVIGLALSIHLLIGLLNAPPDVAIHSHSIDYVGGADILSWNLIPYILCSCVALMISSHRMIQVFGAVVAVSFLVSAYVYFAIFISVWCFFAAADSTLLYFHFKRAATGVRHHNL